MIKIGLIGEDPNDTHVVSNLLSQSFGSGIHFRPVLQNLKGHKPDAPKTLRAFSVELRNSDFHTIILVRDLDGLQSETEKVKKMQDWFEKMNVICHRKGLPLLNIYELEALILADIETFNREYRANIRPVGNVMFKEKPKEYLMQKTFKLSKQYRERDCPELFKKLRFSVVEANCPYFKDFVGQFRKLIPRKL